MCFVKASRILLSSSERNIGRVLGYFSLSELVAFNKASMISFRHQEPETTLATIRHVSMTCRRKGP